MGDITSSYTVPAFREYEKRNTVVSLTQLPKIVLVNRYTNAHSLISLKAFCGVIFKYKLIQKGRDSLPFQMLVNVDCGLCRSESHIQACL